MPPRGLLVPARFLALTAHLVLLVLLVGDTDSPVRASLPPDFSAEEYARAQRCRESRRGKPHKPSQTFSSKPAPTELLSAVVTLPQSAPAALFKGASAPKGRENGQDLSQRGRLQGGRGHFWLEELRHPGFSPLQTHTALRGDKERHRERLIGFCITRRPALRWREPPLGGHGTGKVSIGRRSTDRRVSLGGRRNRP
ncbi:uncharacterized protein LOC141734573 isoform X1 [Larus michahellis]|uniref:uncharacterized protein LOC141734573 isoform X1 n=1 Tax=Larus michahellis TaxID=119627 RepID=UPI003D9B103E